MIEYRPITPADYEAVRQFLSDLGWADRVDDAARFAVMMERTDRTVVAWDEQHVVGFVRALCDDVSNGYLSMLAVAEDKRRQGIGREMVTQLMGDSPEITWVLRAGHSSRPFWEALGFQLSEIAMERTRTKSGETVNQDASAHGINPKQEALSRIESGYYALPPGTPSASEEFAAQKDHEKRLEEKHCD